MFTSEIKSEVTLHSKLEGILTTTTLAGLSITLLAGEGLAGLAREVMKTTNMVMRATTPHLNLNSCGFTIPFGMGMTLGFRLIKPKFLIQHIRKTGSMTSLDEMAYDLMVPRGALAVQSATTSALIIAVALGLKAIITRLSITLPSKTRTMMYV